jgi:protein O-mannosyl-transferase
MFDEGYRVESSADNDSDSLKEKFQFYIKQSRIQILILFVATILVYANSLNVPFYLDDYHSIVENPIIHDISTLLDNRDFQIMRLTGTFSLAANYSLHQTSVLGYHLVNIVIHFLSGIAVFFLLRGLIKAQQFKFEQPLSDVYLLYLPLFSSLIFLLHPLQTQAITYIVQRHASLAALFYIASMAAFVYARLEKSSLKQWLFYLLTAILTVLALFSKENTVTLVASIFLIEILFFQHFSLKKVVLWSISGILLSIILALCLHYFMGVSFELIDRYTHTADVKHISRLEYFSTQTLVMWHYIKLFFIPVGLHLDYDLVLQKSFFSFSVLLALLGHLAILFTTLIFAKQKPILIFAVFFYYIAHSVESGVIPIFDLAFEHRTYLPNLGLSILTASVFVMLLEKTVLGKSGSVQKAVKLYPAIIIGIFVLLAVLTIQRNNQWENPIEFYQNETKLSPNKERVWAELGKVYVKEKRFNEALQAFGKALNLGKEGDTINALPTTFLNTYLTLLYSGQTQKAIYFESKIPVNKLSGHDRSVFYFMQANRLAQAKDFDKAINSYQQATALNPRNFDAKSHLAALYIETGKVQQGQLLLNEVLLIQPQHKLASLYKKKYQSK